MVPIVIVCYNNHEYVDNMVRTIRRINAKYIPNIIILDNNSQRVETVRFLRDTHLRVFLNTSNTGPWVTANFNSNVYNQLPQHFILTDPDLELNPNMPENFIEQLVSIGQRYPWAAKIGLALDISDSELFFQGKYTPVHTIKEHEERFWNDRIEDTQFCLYRHGIDTTFCLMNKCVADTEGTSIRVAGDFTCKHLPWYRENKVYDIYTNYMLAKNGSLAISTTSNIIVREVEKEYIRVLKNNQLLLIKDRAADKNLNFWKDAFRSWEPSTFRVFDIFLDRNKTFIDIGGWIGTTCIYASRLSKDVFVVEPDPASYKDLVTNCDINGCTNVTTIQKAIFSETGKQITIVGDNESTSQIRFDGTGAPVNTLSMKDLIRQNNVDVRNVSLIKVDIEGAEEFILNDLFDIHATYNVPLYISFHYPFLTDKNLDRFTFLTEDDKHSIRYNHFASILFDSTRKHFMM